MTESPDGTAPPLGHLVDALSRHADVASLAHVLTVTLADVLPADMVRVRYERSLADRLARRPGMVTGVAVAAGDSVLSLNSAPGRAVEASVARTVRGVVLSTATVTVTAWIAALAHELEKVARADDAARAAMQRLLLG